MTHDELLAKLDYHFCVYSPALLAVVKLHKPYKVNDIYLCDVEPLSYPCPTIQAIEKELA